MPAFVKIDVEGYEIAVLRGAETLIERSHPWLCIEFNTEAAGVSVLGQWDVHRQLRQYGYVAHSMHNALEPTAATVLPDLPKAYATAIGAYRPRDYDRRFRGPVRAREALASSYNVPAVDVASRFGTSSLLQTLRLAGFTSLTRAACARRLPANYPACG